MIDAFTDEDFRIACLIEEELSLTRASSQLNEKVKFWHDTARGLWVSPGNPESILFGRERKHFVGEQVLTDVVIGHNYYEGHICLDDTTPYWNGRYTTTLRLSGDVVVNTHEKVNYAEFLHLTPAGAWAYKVSYESNTIKPRRSDTGRQHQAADHPGVQVR